MGFSSSSQLVSVVNALYRVRAVERVSEGDGLREVWHQCADGADLLSFVTAEGRVVRQELTLLGDYYLWTSRRGLMTGQIAPPVRASASPDLNMDSNPVSARIERAAAALRGYEGADRYLLHIRDVVVHAAQGIQWHDEAILTHPTQRAMARPSTTDLRPSHWWVVAALGAGIAAVLVTWLWLAR